MKKIYLAIPYTGHENASFREANKIAGSLINQGYLVFSPISHTHPICKECKLPSGEDFWLKYDKTFIEWCDEVWVCNFGQWKYSSGVKAELEIAKELGKKIVFM